MIISVIIAIIQYQQMHHVWCTILLSLRTSNPNCSKRMFSVSQCLHPNFVRARSLLSLSVEWQNVSAFPETTFEHNHINLEKTSAVLQRVDPVSRVLCGQLPLVWSPCFS